jgi:protein-S-isoprenylcysteine O-methyltransferase Ste14
MRRVVRWTVFLAATAYLGVTIHLVRFWVFAAIVLTMGTYLSLSADPTLYDERVRPGGPSIDRGALLTIRLSAVVAMVLAGADISRYHWSDTVPPAVYATSLAVCAVAAAWTARAIVVNRFFSVAVRIQRDRGQYVIAEGPYGLVRHPGYLGMAIALPAAVLGLGSWIALGPALLYSMLIVRRAAIEDRFLQRELDGYREYASRVRFRLVPGLW